MWETRAKTCATEQKIEQESRIQREAIKKFSGKSSIKEAKNQSSDHETCKNACEKKSRCEQKIDQAAIEKKLRTSSLKALY